MKKYLAYILIIIALVGAFGITKSAHAGLSNVDDSILECINSINPEQCLISIKNQCDPGRAGDSCRTKINQTIISINPTGTTAKAEEANRPAQENALLDEVKSGGGPCPVDVEKCVVWVAYILFYTVPSMFLAMIGKVFNILIISSISPNLYGASFISTTWAIVRDISNVFFILILLYTGIKTILGMGSSETKSILANVVIMAVLINFSMFFTKVIIDTSNVVALIFYDKITIQLNRNGQKTEYNPLISSMEKDLSGGLMAKVDPTKLLSKHFFEGIERKGLMGAWDVSGLGFYTGTGAAIGAIFGGVGAAPGAAIGAGVYAISTIFDIGSIPDSILVGIILTVGAILIAFAYAIFIGSISFLGRLIELWILIIFSPFAFMSFSIPALAHMDYVGWDNWSKRIISASFMAPIFMFFLYFIFEIINTNLWVELAKSGTKTGIEIMVLTFLPGIMIAMLMLKAADFAKKGSGQFGEMAMSGFKLAAGLALGAAGLGVAAIGKGTIGKISKYTVNDRARDKDKKLSGISDAFSKAKTPWQKAKVVFGAPGMVNNAALAKIADLKYVKALGEQDKAYGHKAHAEHEIDEKVKEKHNKDTTFSDLTEEEQDEIKKELNKDQLAKFKFGSIFKNLGGEQKRQIQELVDDGNWAVGDGHGKTIGYSKRGKEDDGQLSDLTNSDGITPVLYNKKGEEVAGANPGVKYKTDWMVDMSKTNSTLGEIAQLLRKGGYDPRALHELTGKTPGFNKVAFGTIALVAAGVRMGIKKGGGVDYGTPQKDFYKGIADVISSSLKNIKIDVGGGGGGGGDHGKGGGDHGGGGGHH